MTYTVGPNGLVVDVHFDDDWEAASAASQRHYQELEDIEERDQADRRRRWAAKFAA